MKTLCNHYKLKSCKVVINDIVKKPKLFEHFSVFFQVFMHDDTYTEKLISGFGQKMSNFQNPESRFLFWTKSGAQNFIEKLFFETNSGENLSEEQKQDMENFGLKFLSECVRSDVRIAEEASLVVEAFSRFTLFSIIFFQF